MNTLCLLSLVLVGPLIGECPKQPATGDKEPMCEGRTLRTWLRELSGHSSSEPGLFSSEVISKSADVLSRYCTQAKDAIPTIRRFLDDEDEEVRSGAIRTLISFAPKEESKAVLIRALRKDPSASVRRQAAFSFPTIGRDGKPIGGEDRAVIRALVEAFQKDKEAKVREAAIQNIRVLNPPGHALTYPLIVATKDKSEDVRAEALMALAKFARPKDSLPILLAALEGADESDAEWAAVALTIVGSRAVPDLGKRLDSDRPVVRARAAEALGRLCHNSTESASAARETITALIRLLDDKDVRVRSSAAQTLGHLRKPAAGAVPVLTKALADPDATMRATAAKALGRFGLEAVCSVPALAKALKDSDMCVRRNAAEALGYIGPPAKAAVPSLIETLRDPDLAVRQFAAMSLGWMGKEAKAAVPALQKVMKEDPEMQIEAALALRRITSQ